MSEDGDVIKSAYEKAMERVDQLEPPAKEKQLEWKGVPEGNRIAAEHLRGEGDLVKALDEFSAELRPYVRRGATDVLTANVQLPKTDIILASTDKALQGLQKLLSDKPQVEELITRVRYVAEQYATNGQQQRDQVYEQLKQRFLGQVQESLRQHGGAGREAQVNVEALPEFQQEWLRVKAHLEQQFEEHLESYRQEFKTLA